MARSVTAQKASQAALIITAPSTLTYGSTSTLSTTGGSGTGSVTYSAGSSTGCSVSGSTLSVTNASGNCTVNATKAADTNYIVYTSVKSVALQKAAGSISINNIPASASYGGSFTPTFTKLGNGTASVASTTPAICTVTAGVVSYDDVGTCTLVASVAEGTNHLAATGAPQSFTITKLVAIAAGWLPHRGPQVRRNRGGRGSE